MFLLSAPRTAFGTHPDTVPLPVECITSSSSKPPRRALIRLSCLFHELVATPLSVSPALVSPVLMSPCFVVVFFSVFYLAAASPSQRHPPTAVLLHCTACVGRRLAAWRPAMSATAAFISTSARIRLHVPPRSYRVTSSAECSSLLVGTKVHTQYTVYA